MAIRLHPCNQAARLGQADQVPVPDALVDEVDAFLPLDVIMVIGNDGVQGGLAGQVSDGVEEAAQEALLFGWVVFQHIQEVLALAVVVFVIIHALVMHLALENVGAVELEQDLGQLLRVKLPGEGGDGERTVVFVEVDLQAAVLSDEDDVVEGVEVNRLIEHLIIRRGQVGSLQVEDVQGGGFGFVFEQQHLVVLEGDVGDISVMPASVEVAGGGDAHLPQAVAHLPHLETEVDGVALQLFWQEADHGVLVADAGIVEVDFAAPVVEGELVTAIGVATGAVLGVEHADIHILHPEVPEDHRFLGTLRPKVLCRP